jgi:hypothetical protein
MYLFRLVVVVGVVSGGGLLAREAHAVSPQNPYRSFNLSGINYGSMQWERAQRQGKRVWPYYNTPSQTYSRRGGTVIGGTTAGGGVIMQSGSSQRRSRRR